MHARIERYKHVGDDSSHKDEEDVKCNYEEEIPYDARFHSCIVMCRCKCELSALPVQKFTRFSSFAFFKIRGGDLVVWRLPFSGFDGCTGTGRRPNDPWHVIAHQICQEKIKKNTLVDLLFQKSKLNGPRSCESKRSNLQGWLPLRATICH